MTDERDERSPWDPPAEAWQQSPRPPDQQPYPAPPVYGQQEPYGQPQPPPYGQPQPPPYGQPQYAPQPPPYGQPHGYGAPAPAGPYGQPYYGPATSGKATTVLILGIAGLVLSFGCIGFIPAIIALVLAPGAVREISASGGRLTGESQVRTGKILSWIGLGITALWIIGIVVVVAVVVSTNGTSGNAPASTARTNAIAHVHVPG